MKPVLLASPDGRLVLCIHCCSCIVPARSTPVNTTRLLRRRPSPTMDDKNLSLTHRELCHHHQTNNQNIVAFCTAPCLNLPHILQPCTYCTIGMPCHVPYSLFVLQCPTV
ncbi:hypothetical protein LX32DRAFT_364553 [Colletotrichum zoysiae]|uniref:Uncharacterized protein n=1 Tax=Colletotrichum zoysiae TaxID=1216348 RepID=A0AAD9HJN5_9PEZI|nr:hypothetical protein LX32DRAFT_364553 [Colletotrichum zoysiae]